MIKSREKIMKLWVGALWMLLSLMPVACIRTPQGGEAQMGLDAGGNRIDRIEPPCWWTGMRTPLQLMVHGDGIGTCDVRFEGLKGVKVKEVHQADSPNYLFVDVQVGRRAQAGTGRLVFTRKSAQTVGEGQPDRKSSQTDNGGRLEGERFSVPYEIAVRPDEQGRKSFSSEDLVYLIVPDRFANGDPSNDETPDTEDLCDRSDPNARHGGDLRGIIGRLDYLQDLGVTALWPTPLLEDNDPRVSYHGYACSDYYRIDPRFGDNELYRGMVDEAHKRGIKVLMDVVTNHCGAAHWWMRDLPFRDWIHVNEPYRNTNHIMSAAFDPNASEADRKQMEEGWFVPSMPDMNLDNPFVLNYFRQWAVWWVAWAGLDGLRVDTWYYNEKEPMARWCRGVREEFPWINIVGELWSLEPDFVAYWQEGHPNADGFASPLPSVMDFPLMNALQRAVAAPDGDHGLKATGDLRAVYDALAHDFNYADPQRLLVFFSNHDSARLADICGGDPQKMKLALTLLATVRGIPQLFYGEEWMLGIGTSRRDDGRVRLDFPGFGTVLDGGEPEAEGGGRRHAGSGDFIPSGNAPCIATPTAPDSTVYHYARALFRWRRDTPVLHHGRTLQFVPQDGLYTYFRYDDTGVVMVALNLSDLAFRVPWERYSEITEGLGEGRNPVTGTTVEVGAEQEIGPCDALVLEFKK